MSDNQDTESSNQMTKSEPVIIIYSRDQCKPRGFFLLLFLFVLLLVICYFLYKWLYQ